MQIGDFLKRIRRPVDIVPTDIYQLVTVRLNHRGVIERCHKRGSEIGASRMYRVETGDFILSGIDARNGAFGIVPVELHGAVVTNDFWYFTVDENVIDKHLFLELTSTAWFDDICRRASDGTTQRIRLQAGKFFNQKVTLPKITDQPALLDRVLASRRVNQGLATEHQRQREMVAKLRQAILQDAIQGELTADWREEHPNVEQASDLLIRIQAAKAAMIKDGQIRKAGPPASTPPADLPYDIPSTWAWCYLGTTSLNYDAERIPVSQAERRARKGEYPYYGASGPIDTIDGYTHDGDFLLIGEDGANLVSRSTPIAFQSHGRVWVNNHAHVLGFLSDVERNYHEIHVNAIALAPYVTGGFQPKLSQGNLNRILIAVPPLAEQKAIVERVQAKFSLCAQLEAEIAAAERNAEHLATAILQEVFAGDSAVAS